ncbi:MAG: SpoIID/LytB domain-containing protein [Nitrospiraceae bacterium]|nr:SpoIID/LytB domain-containing protein [Nitrospiraceae bacterium]
MKKLLCLFITALFVLVSSGPEAATVKVLILDDVFQNIPEKDEKLDSMGRITGDLLVSGSHYQGNIEVWKGNAGLYLVNELPLEEYIKNVVSAEVGQNWDMEALKAQAVVSRTYALYQKGLNGNVNFDLTSSVLHQVYKGTVIDARISYAVMHTEGEVLYYNGKLIEALYHSTCGGMTEDPAEVFGKSYPYLKPVESSCTVSPYALWERKIPVEEIEKALRLSNIKTISIKSYTTTKRVKTVEIVHDDGRLIVKSNDLRKALGWSRLPSTNFEVTRENGTFVFDGRGYGHGVGLCQWSALEMAREGKTYGEILSFFYPGSVLRVYENR